MATWHTLESARDEWEDAPTDEDDGDSILTGLLSVSKQAVLAFGPSLPETTVDEWGYLVNNEDNIPDAYRAAQLIKCRIIWSAEKQAPMGSFDNGDYDISTYSLERTFKQILRPKRGVPVIA